MNRPRIAALMVVAAVLTMTVTALTPTADAAHGHRAPKLLTYGNDHNGGAAVRPNGGISHLHGTSASFKRYLKNEFRTLLSEEPAADRHDCRNAPLVVVRRYRTDGWAYLANVGNFPGHGAPNKCAGGGSYEIWHQKHHQWTTVLGGQDQPRCSTLAHRKVPADVWAQYCYRDNHTVKYGADPTSNGPACVAADLYAAAASSEGFSSNDPSYIGSPEGPTAYDVRCYDSYATALISRPNVGTTDGATLFSGNEPGWSEMAQIGYASPCTLSAEGVPAKDIPYLSAGADSPSYCN